MLTHFLHCIFLFVRWYASKHGFETKDKWPGTKSPKSMSHESEINQDQNHQNQNGPLLDEPLLDEPPLDGLSRSLVSTVCGGSR